MMRKEIEDIIHLEPNYDDKVDQICSLIVDRLEKIPIYGMKLEINKFVDNLIKELKGE